MSGRNGTRWLAGWDLPGTKALARWERVGAHCQRTTRTSGNTRRVLKAPKGQPRAPCLVGTGGGKEWRRRTGQVPGAARANAVQQARCRWCRTEQALQAHLQLRWGDRYGTPYRHVRYLRDRRDGTRRRTMTATARLLSWTGLAVVARRCPVCVAAKCRNEAGQRGRYRNYTRGTPLRTAQADEMM